MQRNILGEGEGQPHWVHGRRAFPPVVAVACVGAAFDE
jgi:hypothetical protein